MVGRQGHNARKGKQGFQEVYEGPPPPVIPLPISPTDSDTGVASDLYRFHQIQTCYLIPPRWYTDQYSWEDVVTLELRSPSNPEGQLPEQLSEKYGAEIVLAALKKDTDTQIQMVREESEDQPIAEQVGIFASAVAPIESISRVIANRPSEFDKETVAAAELILKGSLNDGERNMQVTGLTPCEDCPDGQSVVFTPAALKVLRATDKAAEKVSTSNDSRYFKLQTEAEEHRAALENPFTGESVRARLMKRAPAPSPGLRKMRELVLRKQWEIESVLKSESEGIDWFGLNKKRKKREVSALTDQLSRLQATSNELELGNL